MGSVLFFTVIAEIILYTTLIVSFIINVFLIYTYIISLKSSSYLKVSWIWLIINIVFFLTITIIIIFCFLNIFYPNYLGQGITSSIVFTAIIKYNITALVLVLIHSFLIFFCSNYFTVYQKKDNFYCFGTIFDIKKIKKIIKKKSCYIIFYKYNIKIFFKKTTVTKYLELHNLLK